MESPVRASQLQESQQFLLESPQLSIIVPTYQEAQNLPALAAEISAALAQVIPNWELIIVDDNSQDGTVDVCQALCAEGFPLQLIVRTTARGLSSAVIEGFAHARAPILLVMDADLSHPATAIPQLYRAVWEGAEFAIGSRYVPGGGTDERWSWYRWLNSKVAVWLAKPLVSLQDPSAGFFALPRSLLQRCAPLNPIGYKIALEILIKSGATNLRELPIAFRTRRFGQSKLQLTQQLLYLRHLYRLYKFKLFQAPAYAMSTDLTLCPPSPPLPKKRESPVMQKREAVCMGLSGVVLVGLYHLIFGQFYPNMYGKIGHDYALFLPKLLDGYYWYRANGLFAIPWFTPAFCGGIPLLPDPQSVYYSVPQFLSFVTNPLTSVYLTVLLFAALGFVGFYLLLRRVFFTTPWTALLGGGLFLFNGFYAYRMIVGHLTYHPFMLIPALAFVLLRAVPQRPLRRLSLASDIVIAGLLMAYMFHAGMVNVILPALASVVAIGLLQSLIQQQSCMFWRRLTLSGCVALALCSAKLVAALAYLHYFGRDGYRLPGLQSLLAAAVLTVRSLFMGGEAVYEFASKSFVNLQWKLELHEFEYGITVVPLLLLLVGGIARVSRAREQEAQERWRGKHWLQIGVLVTLLLLPIFLNYYTPEWNALLKRLPILKNSAVLIRWVSLYIPVVILLAAVGLDRIVRLRPYQPAVVLLSLSVVVLLNSHTDRTYYHEQYYDPSQIVQAYYRAQQSGQTPSISHIAVLTDPEGRVVMPPGRNDVIAQGYSQLMCYEPLFGYRLETFPRGTLFPGAVTTVNNGYLNLKNPACYVYPIANGCVPGDHFTAQQRPAAEAFITYQPFPFHLPGWQKVANLLNLIAMVGVLGFLMAVGGVHYFWGRLQKPFVAE